MPQSWLNWDSDLEFEQDFDEEEPLDKIKDEKVFDELLKAHAKYWTTEMVTTICTDREGDDPLALMDMLALLADWAVMQAASSVT